MSPSEAEFSSLAGVPVHYDRLNYPMDYGSKGDARIFRCTHRLKDTLEKCFAELFSVWGRGTPTIILTAGTLGDGENAHGQGLAFDLDGFWWREESFTMLQYPEDRVFYLGIHAHLLTHFSQVLGYHYPGHADHFHFDFNSRFTYNTESNAKTFFVQACLKYLFDKEMGATGKEQDGVDGIYGGHTRSVLTAHLAHLGIGALSTTANWKRFLRVCRNEAFKVQEKIISAA